MAEELPLFLGLNDKTVTDIPKTVEKQRYMTSVAPKAANPGKWVEQPRMPIPTGEHCVVECGGNIYSVAGYAKHRVDGNFTQFYDTKSKIWSLKAEFPHRCNHVSGASIGSKIYTFGGFVEQNRCPHSKCFVYDTAADKWDSIAPLSRPRGAISAIALDGKIHLLGGRDVRSLPLRERKQVLRDLLTFTGPLRFTEHIDTDGQEYFRQACASGWEGVIAKRADAPYRAGRSRDWLKFKCENGQEFVIGGFTDPRGTRTGFGALLLGYYDPGHQLIYAGKVGTGFTQRTLDRLHATLAGLERDRPPFDRGRLPRSGVHWVRPRLVAEVGFSEWTAEGELRHPRFQGLRDDKEPAEVVRETPQDAGA